MKRIIGRSILLMLLGVTPFLAQNPDPNTFAVGKSLFQNKCAFCHGLKGNGKGPAAEPLLGHPVDFTDLKFWKEDPELKIEEAVKKGKDMMPAFDLTPEEIKSVILYISQSFKKAAKD